MLYVTKMLMQDQSLTGCRTMRSTPRWSHNLTPYVERNHDVAGMTQPPRLSASVSSSVPPLASRACMRLSIPIFMLHTYALHYYLSS
jgi:hypothetical protein